MPSFSMVIADGCCCLVKWTGKNIKNRQRIAVSLKRFSAEIPKKEACFVGAFISLSILKNAII
jgi:hypothetical protein